MDSTGDLIGTLFTFFIFVLIIILPMAMAFLQARRERKAGYIHQEPSEKKSSGLLSSIDRLRRQDRESEPEVSFSEGVKQKAAGHSRSEQQEIGSGADGPRPSQLSTSQQLGERFTPIKAMSNEYGKPLSSRTDTTAVTTSGGTARAALPKSAAVSRLRDLNEMQRAILLSEILGPPKGLQ
ncbi:MAG: hypothetical protein ACOC2R_08155 [Spirochaetota bacterium]